MEHATGRERPLTELTKAGKRPQSGCWEDTELTRDHEGTLSKYLVIEGSGSKKR